MGLKTTINLRIADRLKITDGSSADEDHLASTVNAGAKDLLNQRHLFRPNIKVNLGIPDWLRITDKSTVYNLACTIKPDTTIGPGFGHYLGLKGKIDIGITDLLRIVDDSNVHEDNPASTMNAEGRVFTKIQDHCFSTEGKEQSLDIRG